MSAAALYGYLCLHFGQARGFLKLMKTNVVNSTFQFLCNQTRHSTPEDIHRLSLAVENVPAMLMYWVLGWMWFLQHQAKVHFNPVSYMHTISGETRDFIVLFGHDLYGNLDCLPARGQSSNAPA